MKINLKEIFYWLIKVIMIILSPSQLSAFAYKILQFLMSRAVILGYCAVLYFLIARSQNLQVIAVFQEISQPWVQSLTSAIVATSATLMFVVRKHHSHRVSYYFDIPVFLLPLLIMVLGPPWGAYSIFWSVISLLIQILIMMPFIHKSLWEKEVKISYLLSCIVGTFFVLYVLTSINPVDFGRSFGVALLVATFLGLLSSTFAILVRWPHWAFVVSVWTVIAYGGNYEFKHESEYRSLPDSDLAEYGNANPFALWLFDRADADFYRQQKLPYPVFLISSEGGGGYAKAHAYTFLSKIAQRCPNFSQHVFALVGVSGGQIGNTMFHTHMQTGSTDNVTRCIGSSSVDNAKYLSTDHLSPLIAQLLFIEAPRKFLFLGSADKGRSAVLIDSFNNTSDQYKPIPDIAYRKHFWNYEADNPYPASLTGKPALVSVSVNVETGNRYIFSPFRFATRGQSHLEFYEGAGDMLDGQTDLIDPSLSSVSIASASFPYVTPSLRFSWQRASDEYREGLDSPDSNLEKRKEIIQGSANLVDGGYFENTGAETLSEIFADIAGITGVSELQCDYEPDTVYRRVNDQYAGRSFPDGSPCVNHKDECNAINARHVTTFQFKTKWGKCEVPFFVSTIIIRDTVTAPEIGGTQNFVTDPIDSLLNARTARGGLAIATLEERKCGFTPAISSCWSSADFTGSGAPYPQRWSGVFQSRIDTNSMKLPLGWHMPLDKMEGLENWVVPNEELCKEIGIPLFEETELYDFDPSSKYPDRIDLMIKRNCSHLRQIGLMFDVEALKSAVEWRP